MLTGWQELDDYWYYLSDKGMLLKNQWVDGDQYYVDKYGRMVTNQWIDDSIYVGADGKKTVNTWEQEDGSYKYKLGDDTYASQRMVLINGKYYAFDYGGYMITNDVFSIVNDNATGYLSGKVHAGEDGVLLKGWYSESSYKTYYFGDDYIAYGTGLYTIEGKHYYFQYENLVTASTFTYEGKLYSSDAKGIVTLIDTTGQTKWVQSDNRWYYAKNGVLLANTLEEIDGSYYYFNELCQMVSSTTFNYNHKMYYADSSGVVAMKKNTWAQADDGQTLYYKENGSLVYNTTFTIDNKLYKFSYSGYLERGIISVYDQGSTKYYLTDESGAIYQTAGWKEYRFSRYYAKEGGVLYTNELTVIDGKSYYFGPPGEMVVNTAQYVGDRLCYFNTNGEMIDSVDSFTGTKEFHGLTYLNKDGNRYYTGEYDGRYYSYGVMQQNCIVHGYYVDFNGKIVKGWIKTDSSYYYADPTTGVLAQYEWLQINGKLYYFESYNMATGYFETDDGTYQFADDGAMIGKVQSGSWIKNSVFDSWQYVNADGTIFDGTKLVLNGTTYYFLGDVEGGYSGWYGLAENRNWYDSDTKTWYWTNATGTGIDTKDGWKKSANGEIGYVENGKLVTGFKLIDGKVYYFRNNGYLAKGVRNYKGKAIVIDKNGHLVDYVEGWNTLGDERFYIKNGLALIDTVVDGCYLNRVGLTHTGTYDYSSINGVGLVHGKLAKNQWIESNYYVDEKGHIVKNQWVGNRYVDRNGYMVKDAWIGDRYVDENGYIVKNQWIGNRYVDGNGYMVKDTWIGDRYVDANGEWKPNGSTSQETKAEWKKTNGKWLYQHKDGTYTKNDFEMIEGHTYYFDENGYMVTGWKIINNKDYFFNASGFMVKDTWQGAYYLGSDGAMLTNTFTKDGYYVGSDGAYYTNRWVIDQGKDYYVNGSGFVVKDAWVGNYYLGRDGAMLTNAWAGNYWCGADGKYVRSAWVDHGKYYVGANGIYVTNQWIGDYYLNGSGIKVTNAWAGSYWCGEDGKYVRSAWVDNNRSYVNESGVYVTNQWIGDYYLNGSGVKVTNAWVGSYWCGSDGKYVKSSWVDNNRYYVNENGVYVAGAWQQDSKGWKYHAGNVYAKDITLNINGTAYRFDSEGYLVK